MYIVIKLYIYIVYDTVYFRMSQKETDIKYLSSTQAEERMSKVVSD